MKVNITNGQAESSPRKITVEWTGKSPCLCYGEWIITIDGEKVELPEEIRNSDMNTYGTYDCWSFGDDYLEEWDSYENGLEFPQWIHDNLWWVADLHLTPTEQEELYNQINEQDWRPGSCGGCI